MERNSQFMSLPKSMVDALQKKKCFLLQVEVLDKKHLRPIMQMVLVRVQTMTVENVLAPTMGQVNAMCL